jgi:hypothetical protein
MGGTIAENAYGANAPARANGSAPGNKQATRRFFFYEEDNTMSKETSDKAAKSASKVLRDGRTGKDSKTAAGSALSQKGK